MAQLTKAEFRSQYSRMFPTSTKLSDAWRKYQLTGVSPETTAVTTTPTTTTPTYTGLTPEQIAYAEEHHPGVNIGMIPGYNPAAMSWAEYTGLLEAGGYPTAGLVEPSVAPPTPITPTAPITIPEVPPITVPTITMPKAPTPPVIPEVPTVPPYEPLPEQVELAGEYAEALRAWREAGGYGIPEEVQTQMFQRVTDILKARETENIRVMRNDMEKRGLVNSGFIFANEQAIRSNTTVTIANSIRDIQISSALMKMASFEKMIGSTAQFIGYLAQESWKTYQPKMAQWEMEARYGLAEYGVAAEYGIAGYQAKVQATMAQFQTDTLAVMKEWQGKFDLMKMELNQAYNQGNIELAGQIAANAASQQHLYNIELAEMEIEAAQQAAMAEGAGNLLGTASGAIATIITK